MLNPKLPASRRHPAEVTRTTWNGVQTCIRTLSICNIYRILTLKILHLSLVVSRYYHIIEHSLEVLLQAFAFEILLLQRNTSNSYLSLRHQTGLPHLLSATKTRHKNPNNKGMRYSVMVSIRHTRNIHFFCASTTDITLSSTVGCQ